MKRSIPLVAIGFLVAASLALGLSGAATADEEGHEKHEHEHKSEQSKGPVTLTGEMVDLMCYLDHGARGKGHRDCARKCIRGNGPVGLLVAPESKGKDHEESGHHEKAEGKEHGEHGAHGGHGEQGGGEGHHGEKEKAGPTAYLIIGDHEPINDKLAPHAAKRITVRGKVVERAGMKMIENVRILEVGDLVRDEGKEK